MTLRTPALFNISKRDGKAHSQADIQWFVRGLVQGEVADYQATAWLMAVCLRGLSIDETAWLTRAMMESGDRYDLSAFGKYICDKHSTGGVGDKVSLILAPLAAACGLKVPMMSGRALGHTGGTLDKLDSISGFNVRLDRAHFDRVLRDVGCVMIGQSESIAPADRKLYALRDVTGTVESIPLITASILSKKLAEGTRALILDVKFGSGAFMKTRGEAEKLAVSLESVARRLGLKCEAVLTPMHEPLGYAVGNAIEVIECIEVLSGKSVLATGLGTGLGTGLARHSDDLIQLTLDLCTRMLVTSGLFKNAAKAKALAREKLSDGSAWNVFRALVEAQGGNAAHLPSAADLAPQRVDVPAVRSGVIGGSKRVLVCDAIGRLLIEMGGGRHRASDVIDPGVGMIFHRRVGDRVRKGDLLATLFLKKQSDGKHFQKSLASLIPLGPASK